MAAYNEREGVRSSGVTYSVLEGCEKYLRVGSSGVGCGDGKLHQL